LNQEYMGEFTTASSPSGARVVSVEIFLPYIIKRTGIRQPRADRRLNAFEAVVVLMSRQWRKQSPLEPARDLRMAESTVEELLAWVQQEEPDDGRTLVRIAVYRSGALTDNDVPDGWVRVLASRSAGTD
jgi:hypothetical protein